MSSRFTLSIALVPSDCNGGRHVDHLRFYAFFEQVRYAYLQSLELNDILRRENAAYVVKAAELVYQAEIFLGDRVTAVVWTERLGNTSVELRYEIVRNDVEVACTGSTTLVFFDPVARQSRPVPEVLRTLMGN